MQKPVFVFRGARVFLIGNGIKKGAVLHTARQEKACRFGVSEDQPATGPCRQMHTALTMQ